MRERPEGRLPPYRIPSEDRRLLRVVPPFPFEGASARVFPLRANLDSLRRFCDEYLNIVPPEVGRFRPAGPFVCMMILDYGRMAVQVENLGWFAQREVLFNVPVEWYRLVDGRWVFQDWATVAPFIFVDHELSMTMGRSVFGWPKAVAKMQATESEWIKDPTAPMRNVTVSTTVFPELYRKRRLEEQTFLKIDHDAPTSNLRLPFDARSPAAPWTIASNLAQSLCGLGRDYVSMLEALGTVPAHWGSDATNYLARFGRIAEWMYPLGRDRAANTLNLKQFRSCHEPDEYCFQALTNGPMRFTAVHRAGLLGEQQVLMGDASGGFSIYLHRWPTLPIFETLGLEAMQSWDGPGCTVAQLKPVFPYWFDANMEYLQGYNVAWRSRDGVWHDEAGRKYPPRNDRGRPAPAEKRFNTTLGAYNKALVGPFRFTGSTIRVLPLLAWRSKLDKLLNRYLNKAIEGTGKRFSVWAADPKGAPIPKGARGGKNVNCPDPEKDSHAYVYLTATAYGDVESSTNNVGDWASLEVAFLLPVLREELDEAGGWKVCGVGVVPVAVYVDDVAAVGAGAEVLGLPTIQARFARPPIAWLTDDPARAARGQRLLHVGAQVIPALGEGQQARVRTILEVAEGDFLEALHTSQQPAAATEWANLLIGEMERMEATATAEPIKFNGARALSLELLAKGTPATYYTLKQLRDIVRPDEACYQSLIGIRRKLHEIHDFREMDPNLVVTIHETPSHPLVETLGLIGINARGHGAGPAYVLQPIRPFKLRVDMFEKLGQRILHRSGNAPWSLEDGRCEGQGAGTFFCDGKPICIDLALPSKIDVGPAQDLGKVVEDGSGNAPDMMPANVAAATVSSVDPQMVLEALLSREWGCMSPLWLERKKQIQRRIGEYQESASAESITTFEQKVYEEEFLRATAAVGAGRSRSAIDPRALTRFNKLRDEVSRLDQEWATASPMLRALPAPGDMEAFSGDMEAFSSPTSPARLQLEFLITTVDNIIATLAEIGPGMEGPDSEEVIIGVPSGPGPAVIKARMKRLGTIRRQLKNMRDRGSG